MAIDFKDPKVIKISIGFFIMLIISIVWYFTSYSRYAKIIQEKEQQLETLQFQLNEAKRNASRFPQIKAECKKIFEEYKALEMLMPPTRDDPEFLSKIHSAAKNTGVFIKGINLLASTKTDFYVVNPYEVTLSGSFFSLGNFLADMAN
ncbi:MAG: type 4a pilus biogenesis protein PilO, partial [bacterium]